MVDSNPASTVIVVGKDKAVAESLVESNTTGFVIFDYPSMDDALANPEQLANNAIVIFDIDSVDNEDAVVQETLKLKQADPSQVLMLIGDKEALAEVLKTSIQPLIYRAFNKPLSSNQALLAFNSAHEQHLELLAKKAKGVDISTVGPVENRTSVQSLSTQTQSKKTLYIGAGLAGLLVVLGLMLSSPEEKEQSVDLIQSEATDQSVNEQNEPTSFEADAKSEINRLNELADQALLDGRLIKPKDDNALLYFNRVLTLDPYDLKAYQGKNAVADQLKALFPKLVAAAEFEQAFDTVSALQLIAPLDSGNDQLRANLETSIKKHVDSVKQSGSAEDIARASVEIGKLESKLDSTRSVAAALENEKRIVRKIDVALDNGNLMPPNSGNAYALVAAAIKNNTISKVNLTPRLNRLGSTLLESATTALEGGDFSRSQSTLDLLTRLNIDPESVAALKQKIDAQQKLAAEKEAIETETKSVAEPSTPTIIPASVISQEGPRYPNRALDRDLEGWVELSFTIGLDGRPKDIKVLNTSNQGSIFESAAIKAIKKWRFVPAKNSQTGEPVESEIESTKLTFNLQ